MKIKAVLFDLDGTLLPMDQDVFVKTYFGLLAKKLAPFGYDPEKLIDAVWKGTYVMIKNTGEVTNEEAFWRYFSTVFGEGARGDIDKFEEFYKTDFDRVQDVCGYTPNAKAVIEKIREKGLRTALATNPIFPAIATEKRIRWAGLSSEDFEFYTTYENSSYCKPNPDYYRAVVAKMGLTPEECVMVGNDVGDDMVTEALGMKVFLLTDCLINKTENEIEKYPHGSFPELISFIDSL